MRKGVASVHRGLQHSASGNDCEIAALPNLYRFTELKMNRPGMNFLFAGTSKSQVTRSIVRRNCFGCGRGFLRISWSDPGHLRQGPHDRQVLCGMVSCAEGAVGKSAADSNNFHIRAVI